MKKIIPFIIGVIGVIGMLRAQQYPLFTNYVLNDFGFNPAIAGSTDYLDVRMTYRTQWTGVEGSPKTQIISGQSALKAVPMGVGGYFFNDVAGQIKRTGFSAAACFGLNIGELGKLGFGASGGFYSFRLDKDFLAENQSDFTLGNAMDGKWTPDLSVGTYFQMNNGAYVGFSVPQILSQKINFNADQNPTRTNLTPHYYAMAGYKYKMNDRITLEPSLLMKVTEAAPMQFDASIRALFNEKYWVGGSFRTQDAATAMLGYELSHRMSIAYAYDFTLSNLREGSNGSHEITLGLRLGKSGDKDEDGIPDDKDECPEEPGTEENNGCPDEEEEDVISDRDKDGILDEDDSCPDVPGPEENQGCPYGDRDKDGVKDEDDKCPDVPGKRIDRGCPKDDRDGDGILDNADKCPDLPGHLANEGCPQGDSDGDGVEDILDKCPNTYGVASQGGCPEVSPEDRQILDLVLRNLYYDTDSDEIRQEAYRYLDKLAELLIRRADWKIKMTGHTDSNASAAYNVDLSKRRVEGVLFYLMNRGVKRQQLVTEYYGEDVPAAPNNTERTRQLNRRVEMEFVWE